MKGILEESVMISISSLTESSLKQYNISIRKWWLFCKNRSLDLYDTKIADIIGFLTEVFHKGASLWNSQLHSLGYLSYFRAYNWSK